MYERASVGCLRSGRRSSRTHGSHLGIYTPSESSQANSSSSTRDQLPGSRAFLASQHLSKTRHCNPSNKDGTHDHQKNLIRNRKLNNLHQSSNKVISWVMDGFPGGRCEVVHLKRGRQPTREPSFASPRGRVGVSELAYVSRLGKCMRDVAASPRFIWGKMLPVFPLPLGISVLAAIPSGLSMHDCLNTATAWHLRSRCPLLTRAQIACSCGRTGTRGNTPA
ncbi:hypothetical protein GE09DRAFT_487585 [Coniochaeta sp. 2T2.1]|nr:hypothetical protein GE09DRAFT_487585 [Coniochaeta sp. 2T2.1]